jgi:hypothetical protein
MLVRAALPEHYEWIASRVGFKPTETMTAIEVVDAKGEPLAMASFDNWGHNCCEMHFAAETPIALRPLARAAFDYIFNELGREYIIALTPASKTTALRWRERVGYREIHRLKDGWAKGDDLVYSVLHRDDCRLLRKE